MGQLHFEMICNYSVGRQVLTGAVALRLMDLQKVQNTFFVSQLIVLSLAKAKILTFRLTIKIILLL